jgi:tetratricopeptide (TPR) repeat protein
MHLDPNHFWAYIHLAALYTVRGRLTEALPIAEKGFSVAPWYPPSVGLYAGILTRLGQVDRGNELLQQLGAGERPLTSSGWALFHICCGEIDLAADWYERVIEERDPIAIETLQTAIGEPIRSSPHWPKLAAMLNLSAESR